jgi:hypothetical protein
MLTTRLIVHQELAPCSQMGVRLTEQRICLREGLAGQAENEQLKRSSRPPTLADLWQPKDDVIAYIRIPKQRRESFVRRRTRSGASHPGSQSPGPSPPSKRGQPATPASGNKSPALND